MKRKVGKNSGMGKLMNCPPYAKTGLKKGKSKKRHYGKR